MQAGYAACKVRHDWEVKEEMRQKRLMNVCASVSMNESSVVCYVRTCLGRQEIQ